MFNRLNAVRVSTDVPIPLSLRKILDQLFLLILKSPLLLSDNSTFFSRFPWHLNSWKKTWENYGKNDLCLLFIGKIANALFKVELKSEKLQKYSKFDRAWGEL